MEADKETVPLLERIKFLSIYSSNLDEFYRLRMPFMLRHQQQKDNNGYDQANQIIDGQQSRFRSILSQSIIPDLQRYGISFHYQDEIPQELAQDVTEYFYCHVAGLLQPVFLTKNQGFFPENDRLYIIVILDNGLDTEQIAVVNIPTNHLDRFVSIQKTGEEYIIFLDEVIKQNLKTVFPTSSQLDSYNIKINRDAVLDILDDDADDITEILERQLRKRKYGFATRFLYEPGLPVRHLQILNEAFDLTQAAIVQGGKYHNSKDLASLPVRDPELSYPAWPAARNPGGI